MFYAQPEAPGAYEGVGAISNSHLSQALRERLDQATREILDAAQSTLQAAGVTCDRLVLKGNKPYELIIQAARSTACDLVFMASHGRRGVGALLLGSETQKVLTHSTIPVLVYR